MAYIKIADISLAVRKGINRYWTFWLSPDGTERMETPMTKKEYLDLGKKGAGAPTKPLGVPMSWTWISSSGGPAFDTPDEKMAVGQIDKNPGSPELILMTPNGIVVLADRKKTEPIGTGTNITVANTIRMSKLFEKTKDFKITNGELFEEIP